MSMPDPAGASECSWEEFETYLDDHQPSAKTWIAFMRDGVKQYTSVEEQFTSSGQHLHSSYSARRATSVELKCRPCPNIADMNQQAWAAQWPAIVKQHPFMNIGFSDTKKAVVAGKLAPDVPHAYDQSNQFWKSIGKQVDDYKKQKGNGTWRPGMGRTSHKRSQRPVKANKESASKKFKSGVVSSTPVEPPPLRCGSPSLDAHKNEPPSSVARRLTPLSRGDQLESMCGFNTALVEHARQKYGNQPGGMMPNQIRAWYEKDMDGRLPTRLRGRTFGQRSGDLQVLHIVSKAKGGHDWVHNYFIDLQEVNHFFRQYLTKEWDDYIGTDAKTCAETFARWVSMRAKTTMTFGQFDPQQDYFLAR